MSGANHLTRVLLTVLCCTSAGAQEAELGRSLAERKARLIEVTRRAERLLDLHIRHALGVPIEDPALQLSAAERQVTEFGGAQRLRDLQEQLAVLRERQLELESRRERIEAARPAVADGEPSGQPILDRGVDFATLIERARARQASSDSAAPPASSDDVASVDRASDPAAAIRPVTAPPVAELGDGGELLRLARPDDPTALGRVLFEAGVLRRQQAERARRSGQHDDAERLAAAGTDYLQQARRTLEASVATAMEVGDEIACGQRFTLARVCERLEDYIAANQHFDHVQVREAELSGSDVPGAWERSAELARSVMNARRRLARWRPAVDLDTLDWRRNRDR